LSEEHKQNIGKASIGKHWWNDGTKEVFQFECPKGFKKGRLPFSKEHLDKIRGPNKKLQQTILNMKKDDPTRFAKWRKK